MSETTKATLSKGRQSWCVIFRHPVCSEADGKKTRIRRGLGTTERDQAQVLVDQLNQILSEPVLWNLGSKELASKSFDPRIVKAFYDPMAPLNFNPWAIRDEFIPLPGGKGSNDGYARVLFVGTTGAGKTTIVRQLLGTDPEKDRFPSISAAKTTISDFEIVLDDGQMRAIVTFIPRDRVRQYICECILAAVVTKLEGKSEREIFRKFLEHSEQKFRLSYLLGNPALLGKVVNDELMDDDVEADSQSNLNTELSEKEREDLLSTLKSYLDEILGLEEKARASMIENAKELGVKVGDASPEDREALQELVEDYVSSLDDFHQLADAILEDVESRFELVADGEFSRGRDGWPSKWVFQNDDRTNFIRAVNRFSSNHAGSFGRLLTPLVEGVRVAGPFKPDWNDGTTPKIVLMDGQGIGHTADSTSSLSTSITSRFDIADAIVLVDNAAQPMQAAPCAVLQSLAISGHESKLIVAFTHFDDVKGDNLLQGTAAKKEHVIGSFDNAIHAIGKSLGRETESALRSLIPDRLVFLSNIQKKIAPESAKFTIGELKRLLSGIKDSIVPMGPVEYKPVYDEANLVLAIQKATDSFHKEWKGLLGMGRAPGVGEAHWSKVKALSRRIGVFKMDEYDNLMPVADLIRSLQKYIHQFLSNPKAWSPSQPPEDSPKRVEAIDAIRNAVYTRLHLVSRRRVLDERIRDWLDAYNLRGSGSTRTRTRDIVAIYEEAAPIPSELPSQAANDFLSELRQVVYESVEGIGEIQGGGGK